MTAVSLLALASLFGFGLSWSSSPAQTGETGSALVTVLLEESDLLAVNSGEGFRVSYEITATIDGGSFSRRGTRNVVGAFPISEVLEYSSLEPGGHIVSVTLTDLESGAVNRREEEIFIDSRNGEFWTSGAVRVDPDGPVRASGNLALSWNVYIPEGSEVRRAAFALLDSSMEVVREGWLEGELVESGVVRYFGSVVLNGLNRGRYRLNTVVLADQVVMASASTSISLLSAWDIWGDDPDVTTTLIRPIASSNELRELERAGGLGDRNSVMADFWNRRDPNPATRGNEFLEEYQRRLDTILREYSTIGIQGVNTDRGIVYAKLGEPDIIENFPFEVGYYPYITWTYFSPSISLTFVDQTGYGLYELVEDWESVNRAFNAGEDWSQ
jgi:GWxTD domain-containing protein